MCFHFCKFNSSLWFKTLALTEQTSVKLHFNFLHLCWYLVSRNICKVFLNLLYFSHTQPSLVGLIVHFEVFHFFETFWWCPSYSFIVCSSFFAGLFFRVILFLYLIQSLCSSWGLLISISKIWRLWCKICTLSCVGRWKLWASIFVVARRSGQVRKPWLALRFSLLLCVNMLGILHVLSI